MKIYPIPAIKTIIGTAAVTAGVLFCPPGTSAKTNAGDTFEKSQYSAIHDAGQDEDPLLVPAEGTSSKSILKDAPSPKVLVQGEVKNAKIIVNLTDNILYKYDDNGNAETAYSVASGKSSTPTRCGVRVVSHVETYPFRGAPPRSKRRRNPRAYGPKIIILDKLDVNTGERSSIGEFIHGTNNPSSIGKYISHGCIRMDNEIIKELASEVKRGDIVMMIRP